MLLDSRAYAHPLTSLFWKRLKLKNICGQLQWLAPDGVEVSHRDPLHSTPSITPLMCTQNINCIVQQVTGSQCVCDIKCFLLSTVHAIALFGTAQESNSCAVVALHSMESISIKILMKVQVWRIFRFFICWKDTFSGVWYHTSIVTYRLWLQSSAG